MYLSKKILYLSFAKVVDITIYVCYVFSELLSMCSVDNVCTFAHKKYTFTYLILAEMLRKFDGILHVSTFPLQLLFTHYVEAGLFFRGDN